MTIAKVDNLLHSDPVHEVTFIHAGLMSQKLYMKDLGMDTNMYLFLTIVLKLIENIFGFRKNLIKDGFEKTNHTAIPILSSFQIFILIMKKRVWMVGWFLIVGDELVSPVFSACGCYSSYLH